MKRHVGKIVRASKGMVANKRDKYEVIPKNILRKTIGHSVNGRPIEVYKVGDGTKPVLITGGIHGNEVGSIKLSQHLINWLNSEDVNKNLVYYAVPCLSPDGFQKALKKPGYLRGGQSGRFNANNVDLNRNFDTSNFVSHASWNYGKNYSQSRKVFAGDKPFSEPETQALKKLVENEDIKIWISLHNAGCDVASSNDALGIKLAKTFAHETGYKLYTHKDWQELKQTGTSKQWCDEQKITYLEIEGSSRWASDWPALKSAFEKTLKSI